MSAVRAKAVPSVMTGTVSTILRVKTTQVLSEEGCYLGTTRAVLADVGL